MESGKIKYFLNEISKIKKTMIINYFYMRNVIKQQQKINVEKMSDNAMSDNQLSYRYQDYQTGTLLCRRRIGFHPDGRPALRHQGQDTLQRGLANYI